MIARPAVAVGASAAMAGLVAVAANSAPSLIALSAVGRRVAPGLAGIGHFGHAALTFDDGPDPRSTPEFLTALDRLGVHATFFMLGEMARTAPGLAAEVAAAGHEIGVHGDRHRSQLRLTPGAVADDMARALDAVADASGVEPRWFRPPYGTVSWSGLRAGRRLGLGTVLWTAWGRDWRRAATPASVAADVLSGHVDGGTILLHDSDCTSAPGSWRAALGALEPMCSALADRGLAVGTVGDHGLPLDAIAA